jgi:DNA-directed RNA polymerase specialized sigma24 family protein/ribosome-associated translation inhibitor RaiA
MNASLSFHDIEEVSRARVREIVEDSAKRIERHLQSFRPELVRLEAHVDRNRAHHLYRVSLRLKLPSTVLASRCEEHDLRSALIEAFGDIEHRIERHIARLRRTHLWNRASRRARLAQTKHGNDSTRRENERRQLLYELIEPELDTLHGYLSREVSYLEAVGDSRAGLLDPSDLLAGTVLRALRSLEQRPIQIKEWLLRLAHEELTAALDAVRTADSLEHSAPVVPEDPTLTDEERYEYWEPEERLKLEDLLPDPAASTPEELAVQRDLRRALVRTLTSLPRTWRRAWILNVFEALTPAQTAAVLGLPEARVQNILQHAQVFLTERLADAGFESPVGQEHWDVVSELGRGALPTEDRADLLGALTSSAQEGVLRAS